MNETAPLRVFIVDDHPLVRAGLAQLLQATGCAVAGEAGSCGETLAHPALDSGPLVVTDLSLGDADGIDLVRTLRRRGLRVVVYSMHEGPETIRRALEAGACGYVTKRDAPMALDEAVRAVGAGGDYLGPRADAALRAQTPQNVLSGQQNRIYRLLGEGCSNEEIASRLAISVRTLESYCARIMDKLGIPGAKELRQQAIRDAREVAGT